MGRQAKNKAYYRGFISKMTNVWGLEKHIREKRWVIASLTKQLGFERSNFKKVKLKQDIYNAKRKIKGLQREIRIKRKQKEKKIKK